MIFSEKLCGRFKALNRSLLAQAVETNVRTIHCLHLIQEGIDRYLNEAICKDFGQQNRIDSKLINR